ncbi:nucleoside permease [uncultured Maribacter sp.]|uniref:nucleoside permease n=1 Tax=uncultured Maribacter sp. TaxID=431308 RepID=UPI0030DDDB46|tara:strand:+ start:74 stop:1303 length:1230 start_codon:yes stop_codon:yes gene_type:complete
MKNKIRAQLCFMMFLEFFIWGAWFVTLGTFLVNNLKATDGEIALAFSTQSWGAIIAPFVIGIIADRYFNAERILGILHLLGAVLMYFMYQSTEFNAFYLLVMGYMILYMPTLALVNSVSFNQMKNPAKEFSMVRVFGTAGWIIAGLSISYIFNWDQGENIGDGLLRNTFLMTAIASCILGVFSFTLPKTPPKAKSANKLNLKEILGLDSLSLFKDKNFLIFFISSVLICIPLAFYYQNANPFLVEVGMDNPTGKMTLGQISEIAFMLLLPYFFTKFGFKKTILVAMAAWVVRYLLFAFGDVEELGFMLIIGIALHGICYDFFFVSGQIYTDSKAGEKFKSSAQGLITLATYGLGMLIGFWVAGKISTAYLLNDGNHVWGTIWLYPAGFALVVFLLFAIFFKTEKIDYQS